MDIRLMPVSALEGGGCAADPWGGGRSRGNGPFGAPLEGLDALDLEPEAWDPPDPTFLAGLSARPANSSLSLSSISTACTGAVFTTGEAADEPMLDSVNENSPLPREGRPSSTSTGVLFC